MKHHVGVVHGHPSYQDPAHACLRAANSKGLHQEAPPTFLPGASNVARSSVPTSTVLARLLGPQRSNSATASAPLSLAGGTITGVGTGGTIKSRFASEPGSVKESTDQPVLSPRSHQEGPGTLGGPLTWLPLRVAQQSGLRGRTAGAACTARRWSCARQGLRSSCLARPARAADAAYRADQHARRDEKLRRTCLAQLLLLQTGHGGVPLPTAPVIQLVNGRVQGGVFGQKAGVSAPFAAPPACRSRHGSLCSQSLPDK
jgi:hypothetical protein